jgi:hypothetical protein
MESSIRIKTDFACVFLLNGTFAESAESFFYPEGEPIFITVLPLEAPFFPYKVQIAGSRPLSNEKLCAVFTTDGKLCVKLFPRYNYIYSTQKPEDAAPAERLFRLVKQKNFAAARRILTDTLSRSVNDDGLAAFFKDYTHIIKDDFSRAKNPCGYYLIGTDGRGTAFIFETVDGLVDNIVENE